MKNKSVAKSALVPTVLKGVTLEQIKLIAESQRKRNITKIVNGKKNLIKKNLTKTGVNAPVETAKPAIPRPAAKYLKNLANDVTRVILPEKGAFNPGLVKMPNSENYVMVYRPDEKRFIGCLLDKNFKVIQKTFHNFKTKNCADPRLIWLPDNRLLMIYSSTTQVGFNHECIRGCFIMDLNKSSSSFVEGQSFRVSPESLTSRQKNWMPFLHEDKIYLVASICPHEIYELKLNNGVECEKVYSTKWHNPWMFPDHFLRGNTNVIQLDDGNYLGTFHTAVWSGSKCYYDNGCYLFSGKPPFKVLKCANRTYLPAEGAVEKNVRHNKSIVCTFPVGMVREDDKIFISYGDNDSVVKIMKTSVDDMLSLMLDLY